MLPAQRNKVDISVSIAQIDPLLVVPNASAHTCTTLSCSLGPIQNLSEEEKKLFRLYGKLPTHKNVLNKMQKVRTVHVPSLGLAYIPCHLAGSQVL